VGFIQDRSRWLEAQHSAGLVAHDEGAGASEYVAAVVEALPRASDDAVAPGAALFNAHEASSDQKAAE
jgi:hypothetical protein